MTAKIVQALSLLLIAAFLVSSCAKNTQENKNVMDYDNFVQEMAKDSVKIEMSGQLTESFIGAVPKIIKIDNAEAQIFEYSNESEMERNSAEINSDGSSVGNTMITWIDKPHFFKRGKIIMLYLGKDNNTLAKIEKILGKQFAGASNKISNFQDCADAGNPIMESYPRQCKADGQTFVEDLGSKFEKYIKTEKVDLMLSYKGGTATLKGTVMRPTPCTEYDVQTIMTKDYPSSNVAVSIKRKKQPEGQMCIQVLGEPFEINEIIDPVSENTYYSITFNDDILFDEKLPEIAID